MKRTFFIGFSVVTFISITCIAGPKDMIKKGDQLFAQREDISKAEAAIKEYKKALALNPMIAEAYWKIAHAYYWIGVHKDKKSDKLKAYKNGIEFAKQCVQVAPKDPHCHYWLGVSYGKYGGTKGILQSLYLVKPMKKEMNTVIKLDPKFRRGSAYAVLGWIYFKLPSIAGGDKDKAEKLLRKAVQIGPNHILNHLFLAKVLLDKGKKEEAIKELKFVVNAPLEKDMIPENKEEKKEAKELLKKLTGGK